MTTLKVPARKLEDATVQYISLVDRGANRVPLRIIKMDKENEMIDLSDVKRLIKGEKPAPKVAIVGLAVVKSSYLDKVKEVIQKSGFSVDKADETEATVLFKQSDEDLSKCHIVKMSDELSIVLKGFCPYDMQDAPFAEQVAANGFFPSVGAAIGTLQDGIASAVYSCDPGQRDQMVAKVDSLCKDFGSYVVSCAKQIPEQAFKIEKEIADIAKASKAKDPDADKDTDTTATGDTNAEKDKAKKAAEVEEAKKAEAEAAVADKAAEQPAALTTESVAKMVADAIGKSLSEALAPVTKQLGELNTRVGEVAKKQGDLEGKVGTVEKSLKGTLIQGEPAADATPSRRPVIKGEITDTALRPEAERGAALLRKRSAL